MMQFARAPAPAFWLEKEAQWAICETDWPKLDPLAWQHKGQTLRELFHAGCRAPGEPKLCAYCDGALRVTARATIDHFAPRAVFQALALAWRNLFPACDLCNETYKRDHWSCNLVRPDVDPVEDWFDVDLTSGLLRPSVTIEDRTMRARVRLTIKVFGLNAPERREARVAVIRALRSARRRDAESMQRDHDTLEEMVAKGPYRFVARRYLEAFPVSTRTPAAP